MQPVPKRGMGCAETNLRYPRTSSTPAATPNVFDPEVCYEQCMADAACLLAVHDGVSHECTMHTRDAMGCNFDSVPSISVSSEAGNIQLEMQLCTPRFEVPFVAAAADKLTAVYKYCSE